MGALEFVAELVKALVWPVFGIVLVLSLRAPVKDLIPILRKLKYGDFEAEFGEQLRALSEEHARTSSRWLALNVKMAERAFKIPLTQELARVNPRTSVLEAWREVEDALGAAAEHLSQN